MLRALVHKLTFKILNIIDCSADVLGMLFVPTEMVATE